MKFPLLRIFLLIVFSQSFVYSYAQHYNYPLNYYSHLFLEKGLATYDTLSSPSFKSTPESWLRLDSVWAYSNSETYYSKASEKLNYDHLININKGELQVSFDLLGVQEFSTELSDTSSYSDTTRFYHNSRGFLIKGSIGSNLSFESTFMENQVFVPTYLRDRIVERDVYPGEGRVKDFNNGGFDFAQSGGYLSYSPSAKVNLQFGHGKSFIGNGHRSLLLSDNTSNYPYFRVNLRFLKNRLKYHTTLATLTNLERLPRGDTPESRFKIKNASFHFLEFSPHPKLSIGLFEAIVWKRYDNEEGTLGFNYASLNPLPLIHSLAFDDENNDFVGFDMKYQFTKNLKVYGQYLLDQKGNGFQLGVRSNGLIIPDLYILAEINNVDPYAYTSEDPLQNYSHINQELGHPLGADFQEIVLRGTYFFKKRIFGDLQLNLHTIGRDGHDSLSFNNGNNIFLSNINPIQSDNIINETVLFSSLTIGYLFNPQSNLNAYIRWIHRSTDDITVHDNSFLKVGIRTSIFNNYDDY